ncbi:hypothetical protein D1164_03940 [Mariniphaga sediminis]|jgi:hypothetical protein|uniref:Receptor L-domain domain-containing protein n=1 Tax=Mariniphaga sediminis TaxID=1628158 RepID=A0A399D4A6_9BACT|nr:hypothetical protein D1164_03940 [Mariniphaga sediminis]
MTYNPKSQRKMKLPSYQFSYRRFNPEKIILKYLFLTLSIFISCNKDDSSLESEEIPEITGPFVTLTKYIIIQNDGDFDKYFGQDSLKGKYIDLIGSIYITRDSVTNLDKLKNLHSISGEFTINSKAIKSLKGLESLTYIGDHFRILRTECIDLTGLLRLKEIGGTFEISSNYSNTTTDGLKSLRGLESIKKIGRSLNIKGNKNLETLEGVESLEEIGGNLSLQNNPLLNKIDNLLSLKSISGVQLLDMPSFESFYFSPELSSIHYLSIQNCNSLINLKGIESIQEIEDISLFSNKNLKQITDLKNTKWVSVHIADNDQLVSLDGLDNPTTTQNIYIVENDTLQNLKGLSNLLGISGTLYLENNGIKSIEELNKLKNIGNLSIKEQNLTNVIFPELESIDRINIAYNYDTISFPALTENKLIELKLFGCKLSTLHLPGITEILDLTIQNCSFISKGNFPVLNHVYNFKIATCRFFIDIMFPELKSINNMEVKDCFNQDFRWIPKLEMTERIRIENNSFLKSLSGLENLNTVSMSMDILDNTSLKDFCPLKSLIESNPSININISRNSENPSLDDILNCE